MTSFQQRLDRGDVLILDGAMGTELQWRGVPMDGVAWSALALATHPAIVRQIHQDYLNAGAEILIANSFAASRHVLAAAGLEGRVGEINRCAVELAREAVAEAGLTGAAWVAGSVSSFVPAGDNDHRPAPAAERASYREQADLLAEAGCDLLALEMLRDIDQACTIMEAAAATGLPILAGFTCALDEADGTVVLRGRDMRRPLRDCLGPVLAAAPCTAVAVMHSDMAASERALDIVIESWRGPVACYPESGEWENPAWRFGNVTPDGLAAAAETWVDRGVGIVGGCCGIGPDHIRDMSDRLRGRQWAPRP